MKNLNTDIEKLNQELVNIAMSFYKHGDKMSDVEFKALDTERNSVIGQIEKAHTQFKTMAQGLADYHYSNKNMANVTMELYY